MSAIPDQKNDRDRRATGPWASRFFSRLRTFRCIQNTRNRSCLMILLLARLNRSYDAPHARASGFSIHPSARFPRPHKLRHQRGWSSAAPRIRTHRPCNDRDVVRVGDLSLGRAADACIGPVFFPAIKIGLGRFQGFKTLSFSGGCLAWPAPRSTFPFRSGSFTR